MSDYVVINQSDGKPILWEYCKPEADDDNVVLIGQAGNKPIIAKCPPPTEDGENVIVATQPDGTEVICGRCSSAQCAYNNKTAYLGYAEAAVPEDGVYIEDIAALNAWMTSSLNHNSTIMVNGAITIDIALYIPAASSFKFIGVNGAKLINENSGIGEIVRSGDCPCLYFYNIEFYATTNFILHEVKGVSHSPSIPSNKLFINMTDETINPNYWCKYVVDGWYVRLYKPDADGIENVGRYLSTLAAGATASTNSVVFKLDNYNIDSTTATVGSFFSAQKDSWEPEINADSGTFFITDDNEDGSFDFTREQKRLARFEDCKFSYVNTTRSIDLFRGVRYTEFINCDFSGNESTGSFNLNIGVDTYTTFRGCDFSNCAAGGNLTFVYGYISRIGCILDNCDFTGCTSGNGIAGGDTYINIRAERLVNQSINLVANSSSGSHRHGNSIYVNSNYYIDSSINITGSAGVGYARNGGNTRLNYNWEPYLQTYKINSTFSGTGGDGGSVVDVSVANTHGGDGGTGIYLTNWYSEPKYVISSTVYGKGGDGGLGGFGHYYGQHTRGGHGGNGHTIAGIGGDASSVPFRINLIDEGGFGGNGGNSVDGAGGLGGVGGDGTYTLQGYPYLGNGGNGGTGGNSINGDGGNGGTPGNGVDAAYEEFIPSGDTYYDNYFAASSGGSGGNGGSSVNGNGGNGADGGVGGDSINPWLSGGPGGNGGYGGNSINGDGGNGGNGMDGGVCGIWKATYSSYGGWGGNSQTAHGGDGGDGGTGSAYGGATTDGFGGCGGYGLLGDGADGLPYDEDCDL